MFNYKTPVLTDEEKAKARSEDVAWVQKWLNLNADKNLEIDGVWGTSSQAEFISAFTCRTAIAITEDELMQIAADLGDSGSLKRIRAVAAVESIGSGWFNSGLPLILYERHRFWKYVQDVKNKVVSWFANPVAGDYTMDVNRNGINDSWEKLTLAVGKDPLAAMMSVSIGKFQVMGEHYRACGYNHPIEMLFAASRSEYAQYCMLRDYILKVAHLKSAFLALSTDAAGNRAFARGYNGAGFEKNHYHVKLAKEMA